MGGFLDRYFRIRESGSTPGTEAVAGLTTFLTMCYILFVQPAILSDAGMDPGAVFSATCLACAFASIMMGIFARYPIALAPGMGHNVFFTYTVCLAMGIPWQTALGAIFISGTLFIVLSTVGFREKIMQVVPECLRHAIAVGIGLLIAFVGLMYAGVIQDDPVVYVKRGFLDELPTQAALVGVLIAGALLYFRFRAAILAGMVFVAAVGILQGFVKFQGIIMAPPSLLPTLGKLDIPGALSMNLLTIIFVFFILDLFDTVGTLIGVGEKAGLLDECGRLPRARRALLTDAVGTAGGAVLGTSTVTSYVESSAGIAAGGRTGLTAVVTGLLFLAALVFAPLAEMFGGAYAVERTVFVAGEPSVVTVFYRPCIAPALIVIGGVMMTSVRRIRWDDITEALPAFLCILIMPAMVNITEGIAFGFIAYAALKLFTGRGKEVHWLVYVFAVLFVARYLGLGG
jgi:AGZA family xanthine/uracil permease-like MFS transporter